MPTNKPKTVSIRSYQVGFGDCFLVTFGYAQSGGGTKDVHILVDCGSTGIPEKPGNTIVDVAKEIERDCGGKLDIVVATHRHKDHISGFATNKSKTGPGDIIARCKPDLVVQPWTEDPDVAPDAKSPLKAVAGKRSSLRAFTAGLQGMHDCAALVAEEAKLLGNAVTERMRRQLSFLGETNLANLSAVENLMKMGKDREYLSYGKKTKMSKLLPGVKIHVLGPPTPADYPDVETQRSKDKDEFWHLLGASSRRLFPKKKGRLTFDRRFAAKKRPAHARWFAQRVMAAHVQQRLELVRALDDAMNNTSLILVFEVGGKKLLFPGDAQIENWNYALKDSKEAEANRKLLAETDFYKVGHHGSLNATPKTLWKLFSKKGDPTAAGTILTAVSTMAGKHGSPQSKTEVPRSTLVTALEESSVFFTTQRIKKVPISKVIPVLP